MTGVEHYSAHKEQRDQLFSQITKENYEEMCLRIKELPEDDTMLGGTNLYKFIERLSSENLKWIEEINNIIE